MPASNLSVIEVAEAMKTLRLDVLAELDRRNLNATGAMAASVDDDAMRTPEGATGTLSALDYWVNVGSGTPPGQPVFIADIQKWIDAKGLSLSARAVTRRIRRIGSKDFREHNPNAFETAITAWEASPQIKTIGERSANSYGEAWVELLQNSVKH